MFARMMFVRLRPGSRYQGEKLAARWQAGVATLPGFVSVSFFGDEERGEYGYFSLWETREDAERVPRDLGEPVSAALAELAVAKPEVRIYGVYQPPG